MVSAYCGDYSRIDFLKSTIFNKKNFEILKIISKLFSTARRSTLFACCSKTRKFFRVFLMSMRIWESSGKVRIQGEIKVNTILVLSVGLAYYSWKLVPPTVALVVGPKSDRWEKVIIQQGEEEEDENEEEFENENENGLKQE